MARIFVSPLAWGLGHATRDIPIIKEFLARGHQVTIATSGNALALLRREFPECAWIEYPDYPAPYTRTRWYLLKFTAYIPVMLRAMEEERKMAERLFRHREYDLIVSDNRFGVYAPDIPSFFISHQLRFSVPWFLKPVEWVSEVFNSRYHERFTAVIVPDNDPATGVSLSGKLCCSGIRTTVRRTWFAGILSSVGRMAVPEDIDYLITISGPEPQRTRLEEILLPQVPALPGKKVVLLGRPCESFEYRLPDGTIVRAHARREEMAVFMNRARFIISRSGYTTVMEIAELGKKQCLFIPTPGQTEQEYLSVYYRHKGWFYSKSQYALRLAEDTARARRFSGFPPVSNTADNVRRLYDELFSRYLE